MKKFASRERSRSSVRRGSWWMVAMRSWLLSYTQNERLEVIRFETLKRNRGPEPTYRTDGHNVQKLQLWKVGANKLEHLKGDHVQCEMGETLANVAPAFLGRLQDTFRYELLFGEAIQLEPLKRKITPFGNIDQLIPEEVPTRVGAIKCELFQFRQHVAQWCLIVAHKVFHLGVVASAVVPKSNTVHHGIVCRRSVGHRVTIIQFEPLQATPVEHQTEVRIVEAAHLKDDQIFDLWEKKEIKDG